MLFLWLAVQSGSAPAPSGLAPVYFDLAEARTDGEETGGIARCRGRPGELVVCGRRRGNDYPLEEMERRYRWEPPKAEIGLGGGTTARAYLDQVELPQGQISKRVMVGIKLPF